MYPHERHSVTTNEWVYAIFLLYLPWFLTSIKYMYENYIVALI